MTLSESGGTGPFTWSLTGSLPPGVSLNLTTGAITGTPTTPGPYSFTVTVTDSLGGSGSQAYTLTINPGPNITTTSLPQGEVTVPYSHTLAATGGSTSYTWSLSSGSLPLPGGLSIVGSAITGTPTLQGTYTFTVQVTDSNGGTASQPLSIKIVAGPSITSSATLAQGEVGAAYSQTLTATGGSTPYTWSVAGSPLPPPGLSLTGDAIAGTPTAAALGTSSFTVKVTDHLGGSATMVVSVTIISGPTITTAPGLPNGTVGVAYSTVTLAASDGTTPYTWSITTGSLPQGLTLGGTLGTISGQPTASGTSNFTVQVLDAKGVTNTKAFTINIAAGLTITTPPVLPGGTIGSPYSATVAAAGGTKPYTFTVTAGSLPSGLTFTSSSSGGTITGIPNSSGTFTFTVQVTDSASVTATKQFTLSVTPPLAFTTSPTLPSGSTGTLYTEALGASGGTPPYTSWAITAGALPGGLSLSALTGVIAGTPSSSGTFIFTVEVKDSNQLAAVQQFSLTVVAGLTIATPSPLPSGAANTPYSTTLSAAGGTAPYTWTLIGTLPAGLSLSKTGTISGTPRANGTSTFSVQVQDQVGATATKQFSLTIGAGLTITSGATLPAGTVNKAYLPLALAAVGGTQPYSWSVSTGPIAPGLALSSAGVITGTPSQTGAFSFTVQVKDSSGSVATQTFTISVIPPSLPEVIVAGAPQTSSAGQQLNINVTLATPYPLDISGEITMTFQPDAVVPITDPAMVFVNGLTTAGFTIPANSTTAVFSVPSSPTQLGLQTGTVSGTITLSFTLTAGGAQLPATGLQRTIIIPRSVPVIKSVHMVRTSAGLEIHVIAYSPQRDLTEADLTFSAAPGATLQTTSFTEALSSVASTWYKSANATQFGSQLMLVLPFTASQGSVDAVGSVSVVLKNAQGNSSAVSGTF